MQRTSIRRAPTRRLPHTGPVVEVGIRIGSTGGGAAQRSILHLRVVVAAVVLVAASCSGAGGSTEGSRSTGERSTGTSPPTLPGWGEGAPEASTQADQAALQAFREVVGGAQDGQAQEVQGRFVMPRLATADARLFMVGDSVLEATWPTAAALLPSWSVTADAEVGRRVPGGITTVDERRAEIGDVAVVVLGHNYLAGEGFEVQFARMMESLSGLARVVWVTPAEWSEGQDEVGSVIRLAPARFPNVVVADWAALAGENPGYLQGDGVHLTVAGVVALADLIARSVGPGPRDGVPGVLLVDVPPAPSPPPPVTSTPRASGPTTAPQSPRSSSSLPSPPSTATTSTSAPTSTTATSTSTSLPPATGTLPP